MSDLRSAIMGAYNRYEQPQFTIDITPAYQQVYLPPTTGDVIANDQRPTILYGQQPPYVQGGWRLPALFFFDAHGARRVWQVGFDGQNSITMVSGLENGAPKQSSRAIELNTTGRDYNQQAMIHTNDRYLKKTRKGYAPHGVETKFTVEPMLADKYKPYSTKIVAPMAASAKLDGIRVIVRRNDDGNFSFLSRHSKEFTQLGHTVPELRSFFNYLPPGAILDTESYNHRELMGKSKGGKKGATCSVQFDTISGIMRTQAPHPMAGLLHLWIHDIDYSPRLPFEQRYNVLLDAFHNYKRDGGTNNTFTIIPIFVLTTHEEVLGLHAHFKQEGYEGIVFRWLSNGHLPGTPLYNKSLYNNGRSGGHLFKYKTMNEDEGLIIGIDIAKGDQEGAAIFVVQSKNGVVFNVSMKAPVAQRRYWAQNPTTVLQRLITYEFQDITADGAPRFPVGKAIRDYEVPQNVTGPVLFNYYS